MKLTIIAALMLTGLLLLFGCTSTKENRAGELDIANLSNASISAGSVLNATIPISEENSTIVSNPLQFNLSTTVINKSEVGNKTETERESTGLKFSNYVLVLDDVIQQGPTDCASISIYANSPEATLLHKGILCPGKDYYWVSPDQHRFRILMTSVAGGYSGNSIWANVIVYG